jgi:hypothetical protein
VQIGLNAKSIGAACVVTLCLAACSKPADTPNGGSTAVQTEPASGPFGEDLAFLQQHTDAILLSDEANRAQVIVVPEYQGRVMTSTTSGPAGPSFGWINRELIASGETLAHMNPYGGEDRFWLGPEGGQFALYFKAGDPFEFEYWQTPALIDTEPFGLKRQTRDTATFEKDATLTNYSGTEFTFRIERAVNLLGPVRAAEVLGAGDLSAVDMVAYETVNTLTNTGQSAWTKETGLLSIWILGMFNPSPETTVVIPIVGGDDAALGPKVNDTYFGKVPEDRLRVTDDVLFFRGDGEYRSKIGVSPRRAKPVAGSYDAGGRALTIVQYNQPRGATDYVNSMWEVQDAPYAGDAINSYNDGPPEPGAKPMGPFYELETSSPAAALAPGESILHIHRTFHFQGDEPALNRVSNAVLGVSLVEIAAL